MKSLKHLLFVLLTILVIAAVTLLAFLGIEGSTRVGIKNINLGLDLAGGVSITYQAEDADPTNDQMEDALAIINHRLSALGYTEAQAFIENGNRIRVEIPGVSDADEAVRQIGKTAMLTFVGVDWAALVSAGYTDEYVEPCTEMLKQQMDAEGYSYSEEALAEQVKSYLESAGAAQYYFQDAASEILQKAIDDGLAEVVLSGDDIADATAQHGQTSQTSLAEDYVKLALTSSGSKKFEDATSRFIGKQIAIRLDQTIVSIPNVNGTISDNNAIITGMADNDEARLLASDIRGGAMPVKLVDIEHNSVGATLGRDALSTSLKAAVIGFIFVILFMIVIYRIPGIVAAFSLVFYISAELLLINLLNITLTLPGIAGIILSIGMAVDANVVIFARINEELTAGRGIRAAVASGFRKALSAILDGNITTLLAAAVLWVLGTGPVQGFALTLALGILISMFTALVLSNFLLKSFVEILPENPALYRSLQLIKSTKKLPIVSRTRLWFIIPAVVFAIGLGFLVFGGLNLDTDFAGGTMMQINMEKDYDNAALTALVKEKSGDANPMIQAVSGAGQDHYVSIKVIEQSADESEALYKAIAEQFGLDAENKENLISLTSISPTISGEMTQAALKAIVIAAILMLIYITIRFRDFRFGLSSIAALLHDVLIVIAMYAIFRIPVNSNFIAAMLTIVGYSINNTIIVFDRIRENRHYYRSNQLEELADVSVTQTMGRSINTSLTTIIMVLMLFVFGVESIRWFSFPLLAGFVAGTYSSLVVASPLWVLLEKAGARKLAGAHKAAGAKKKS